MRERTVPGGISRVAAISAYQRAMERASAASLNDVATVAHDQVGAQPQRHDRRVGVERAHPAFGGDALEQGRGLFLVPGPIDEPRSAGCLHSLREFAGEDYEAAVVPEKARRLLERFDARSQHYETVLDPGRNLP